MIGRVLSTSAVLPSHCLMTSASEDSRLGSWTLDAASPQWPRKVKVSRGEQDRELAFDRLHSSTNRPRSAGQRSSPERPPQQALTQSPKPTHTPPLGLFRIPTTGMNDLRCGVGFWRALSWLGLLWLSWARFTSAMRPHLVKTSFSATRLLARDLSLGLPRTTWAVATPWTDRSPTRRSLYPLSSHHRESYHDDDHSTTTTEESLTSLGSPPPLLPELDTAHLLRTTNELLTVMTTAESATTAGATSSTASVTASTATATATAQPSTTRRLWLASGLLATGLAMAGQGGAGGSAVSWAMGPLPSAHAVAYRLEDGGGPSKLQWEVTPVNKRTGVTVFDAEEAGYNVPFVTYLSRFLLCFDEDCQRWWYSRAADIPRTATTEQVQSLRLRQFGAFSASVEVGLQGYRGPQGPSTLMQSLLKRYSPNPSELQQMRQQREQQGLPPLPKEAQARQEREIKEARRQIALLFGLMEKNQPVEDITKLLAAIDNGSIAYVKIVDPGSGYAPGYGPPEVRFPPPEAGPEYVTASGRAILSPNGRLLRVDVVNRGAGYAKPPEVSLSPPAVMRFGDDTGLPAATAEARAYLFRSGPNQGRVERIELTNPGAGYRNNEIIRVRCSPPETPKQNGGVTATATAVLEYEVSAVQILNNGTGYAVEKPLSVYVEPPPLTARVNMNDPLMARIISPNEKLPATTIPTPEMKKRMPDQNDPNSLLYRIATEANNGGKLGGGGCYGRACYDDPVVAVAYAEGENSVFQTFRNEDDAQRAQRIERALDVRGATAAEQPPKRVVSASSSQGLPELLNFGGGASSSSSQLLSLLPAGIGLEYKSEEGRYVLAADPSFPETITSAKFLRESKRIDPDFGPRGRSPIERDMELGITAYLRFVASGAICCSGVHLALTPIDVVKTKVQTDPERYPGIIRSFRKVLNDGGLSAFFTGWAPTFLGFFVWGGLSYALTEFLRRTLTETAGAQAGSLEVPIILSASGMAAFVGSFVLCPFEAVRIRSVAQQGYAPTIVQVLGRMVQEEGLLSLFSAVPAFLFKEIPFAMAKFTVFDLSTAAMYDTFPAAKEDLQLSLLVSLAGGTLGGIAAAVVSNPADVTISQMKKAKSEMGPAQVAQKVLERGGPAALFTGLPLRMVFYSLLVSLQFLIYDAVRFALGIGSDDLKLYLDVLGGALRESGGPV